MCTGTLRQVSGAQGELCTVQARDAEPTKVLRCCPRKEPANDEGETAEKGKVLGAHVRRFVLKSSVSSEERARYTLA